MADGKTTMSTDTVAACGCGCAGASAEGRKAVGVDADLKQANLKHLRRIEGQVRGIARMIEADRYCADIIMQVTASRESLHAVARNLLRNHLTHCAAAALGGPRSGQAAREEMIEELLDLVGKLGR